MSRVLIGFKDMKNKDGKVLYFGETNPWTEGLCINDDKRYSMGFVYGDNAKAITNEDIGKEFKYNATYERK